MARARRIPLTGPSIGSTSPASFFLNTLCCQDTEYYRGTVALSQVGRLASTGSELSGEGLGDIGSCKKLFDSRSKHGFLCSGSRRSFVCK